MSLSRTSASRAATAASGEQIEGERTSAADLAPVEMGACRRDRAALLVLERIGRGEAKRVLGELGGGVIAPRRRQRCRLFQRCGHLFVGWLRRERKVPRALDRIVDDGRKLMMGSRRSSRTRPGRGPTRAAGG